MFRFAGSQTLLLLCFANPFAPAQQPAKGVKFPCPQKLTYRIEWRLVNAGTANLQFTKASGGWQTDIELESAGLVNRLYRVSDRYKVLSDDKFCAASAFLDAQEGKKHTVTKLTFDDSRHKVDYDEHDFTKNTGNKRQIEIAPCTHEVAGALAALGELDLQPGKSMSVPITDGKKMVFARVEAQAKESVAIDGRTYQTIRYEAFLFDNVLYKRKGRLFLWVTDDPERTPVQFRIQLGFPIGNILLELERQQKL